MENLDLPSPPKSKMGKWRVFALRAASSLIWGGWGFAVPFYFVQDCSLIICNHNRRAFSHSSILSKDHTRDTETKGSNKIPYLRTENLKNHTLFRRTYLYCPYMGVPTPRAKKKDRILIKNLISNK